MKVGIITLHSACNPGAMLQAYALQEFLKNKGFYVRIIDYRNTRIEYNYNVKKKLRNEKNTLKNLVYKGFWLINYKSIRNKEKRFKKFMHEKMLLTSKCDNTNIDTLKDAFDIYVSGSDQVWSFKDSIFDKNYFLNFVNNGKKVSYASSTGMDILEHKDEYYNFLKSFSMISVRENFLVQRFEEMFNCFLDVHVDPTLLLGKDAWNQIKDDTKVPSEKYILLYTVQQNQEIISYAKAMRDKTGCQLIKLNEHPKDVFIKCKKIYDFDPCQFISLIENATYVLTDSFHGTIFSILYNVPFVVALSKTNKFINERIVTLLKKLDLESHIYDINNSTQERENPFSLKVKRKIEIEINKTENYVDKWTDK